MENNPYAPPSSEIPTEEAKKSSVGRFFQVLAGVLLIIFSLLILIISIVGGVAAINNLFSDSIPNGIALSQLLGAALFLVLGIWLMKVGIRLVSGKKKPEGANRKPIWVKLFLIYVSMGAIGIVYSYLIMSSGSLPMTPEQRAYFDNQGMLDYLLIFSSTLLNLAAGITLFRLRAIAVKLLLITLILSPILMVYTFFISGYSPASPAEQIVSIIGSLVGMGILIAIFVYSLNLKKQGKLT
ncbi:MAG: hypothetical protein DRR16_06170 [Candidatus Parabeggiatoa sp. nov. 3]|nr:MAG: hypothetical protein DRR00_02375 [Gammaproteobacteria bacterium]RKZ69269.1 MAG: hypothetical protein DRQ99_01340 [Gammaproteobacteria bacterium]RKZ87917.1 MAG: hypothetical protein DRR16_06170 [Gammaproteobacteria bacterium]